MCILKSSEWSQEEKREVYALKMSGKDVEMSDRLLGIHCVFRCLFFLLSTSHHTSIPPIHKLGRVLHRD